MFGLKMFAEFLPSFLGETYLYSHFSKTWPMPSFNSYVPVGCS